MSERMICTCNLEGLREVQDRRLRIFNRMGLNCAQNLTTSIVLSLAFDFQCEVFFDLDMWFGASLETSLLPDHQLYIESDNLADALAYFWEYLADKFPERASVKEQKSEKQIRIEQRLSEILFFDYQQDIINYNQHIEVNHNGRYSSQCDDCYLLLNLNTIRHQTLDNFWGCNDLDLAIQKYLE